MYYLSMVILSSHWCSCLHRVEEPGEQSTVRIEVEIKRHLADDEGRVLSRKGVPGRDYRLAKQPVDFGADVGELKSVFDRNVLEPYASDWIRKSFADAIISFGRSTAGNTHNNLILVNVVGNLVCTEESFHVGWHEVEARTVVFSQQLPFNRIDHRKDDDTWVVCFEEMSTNGMSIISQVPALCQNNCHGDAPPSLLWPKVDQIVFWWSSIHRSGLPPPIVAALEDKVFDQAILRNIARSMFDGTIKNVNLQQLKRYETGHYSHQHLEELQSTLVSTVKENLEDLLKWLVSIPDDDSFLHELNIKWNLHKRLTMIAVVLLKDYDTRRMDEVWAHDVISDDKIMTRLLNKLDDLIRRDRSGQTINRRLLSISIMMLHDSGVKNKIFVTPFVARSTEFYKEEALRLITQCSDCADYLKRVEDLLYEEHKRLSCYLCYLREGPQLPIEEVVTNVVLHEMITSHSSKLLYTENWGLLKMLANDRFDDLGRLYKLFLKSQPPYGCCSEFLLAIETHIGSALAGSIGPDELRDPVECIASLVQVRDKYGRIISIAFNGNETYLRALDSVYQSFIPSIPCVPEYISLFLDHKLRQGFDGVEEEDIDILLDKVMKLLRLVGQKGLFEEHYEQHLKQRLLSEDADTCLENLVTSKLAGVCGFQFSSKLQAMIHSTYMLERG